jgi:hypothetical protein
MKTNELNNIKYYVGQNARENWQILDTAMSINNNYIWFHLNSFPSPYVIMYATIEQLEGNDISTNHYLQFGAELCREHSKYKFLKDMKIMYVPIKKLTKTEKVGEVNVSGKAKIIKL